MNTFSIDSWYKPTGAGKSIPMGIIRFHVNEHSHRLLEQAEEHLSERTSEREMDIPVEDVENLRLEMPEGDNDVKDCQFHVYLSPRDGRGHFFLTGHRPGDDSLFYSNAVMVDLLG